MKTSLAAALFDDPAGVHDGDPVARRGENGQIVADEHDAQAEIGDQRREQVENLRLDHDIERGGGFVGDEQAGPAGQGHRDHHPLLLPTGELMRVVAGSTGRQADLLQELTDPRACGLRSDVLVQQDRFGELGFDALHRVERVHRALEHHSGLRPADRAQLAE